MNDNITIKNLINHNLNKLKKKILAKECVPPLYFKGVITDKQPPSIPIFRNIITNYQNTRNFCNYIENNIITDSVIKPSYEKPENWWPVGDISYTYVSNYIDITPLRQFDKRQKLQLQYVAQECFNLSAQAVNSILTRQTSLLFQVSNNKSQSRVYFEVKRGVYYMLQRGTVIKFLTDGDLLFDFLIETAVGLCINNSHDEFKSFVGIKAYCPEGLCAEMDFAGITLYDIIHYREEQPLGEKPYYAVKMLQGDDISRKFAADVIKATKQKLLEDLPFFIVELINLITQISRHGLVNPDIKLDNIVVDIVTGQPKMIDFQLVLPEGEQSRVEKPTSLYVEETLKISYHVALEYIKGEACDRSTMTFSLCHLIYEILKTLDKTNNVDNLFKNSQLINFINLGLSDKMNIRPNPVYVMAPIIGDSYQFDKHVAQMFSI